MRRPGLRGALLLQVVLPLLALVVGVLLLTFTAVERVLEQRMHREIEVVARAISMPVAASLERGSPQLMSEALQSVFQIGRVYGAYVYDVDGQRVAALGKARPTRDDARQVAELVQTGEQVGQYQRFAGEDVYSFVVPLPDTTGRINGLVQVIRQRSDIEDELQRLQRQGWMLTLAVGAIMVMILLLGHRRAIGRHVAALQESMQQVASGDRDHRTTPQGPLELRGLAEGLNRMLDGIQAVEQELAEQRLHQDELTAALQAQEKMAALGRFASGVAHELGAPLTVIDGHVRRVAGAADCPDDARRRLAVVREQIERTRGLVRQLLDVVRTDARRRQTLRLDEIARSAIAAVSSEAQQRGASLQESLDAVTLEGNSARLGHAISNGLRNALQEARTVQLTLQRKPGHARLIIDDDGPGIDASLRESVFEPFVTRRSDGSGTGLGLAIVRSVAAEHDGRAEIGDSPLGGCRLILDLPLAEGGEHE